MELEIAGRQITASCKVARKKKSNDSTNDIAVWNRHSRIIYITLAVPGQMYEWLGTPAKLNIPTEFPQHKVNADRKAISSV